MVSCSKPGKDNKASYKTVLKWEKEFGTKFVIFMAKMSSVFNALYW